MMERFYVFVLRNDVWIYILSAMGLFWYVNELIRAQRMLRRAVFGLERETATHRRNNALAFVVSLAAIAALVYYVNARIAPTLPPQLLRPPTPTADIFATPLASPTPLGTAEFAPPTPTIALAPTVTLPGAEAGLTIDPAATASEPPPTPFLDCTIDLNISQPGNGAIVSGTISFFGTADTEDFGHYRLEANGPETNGQWASLLGRNIDQAVATDGFLGSANLSQWASGPYLIRLTAVDTADNDIGQCIIQVTLNNG